MAPKFQSVSEHAFSAGAQPEFSGNIPQPWAPVVPPRQVRPFGDLGGPVPVASARRKITGDPPALPTCNGSGVVVGNLHDGKQRRPLLPRSECGQRTRPAVALQRISLEHQRDRCHRLVLNSSLPCAVTVIIPARSSQVRSPTRHAAVRGAAGQPASPHSDRNKALIPSARGASAAIERNPLLDRGENGQINQPGPCRQRAFHGPGPGRSWGSPRS